MKIKMAVSHIVASCSLVEFFRRFRGAYCLHHQGGRHLAIRLRENLKCTNTEMFPNSDVMK
jgi:hypothetical protein